MPQFLSTKLRIIGLVGLLLWGVLSGLGGLPQAVAAVSGSVSAWGYNAYGQTNVPTGLNNVIAIAAGGGHSLALKSDGTVVAWGYNREGETNVPTGLNNVIAISAGYSHSLALKSDGTVVGWGNNTNGETNVPTGLNNVVAISSGSAHNLALKSDGTVVAWGYNYNGQTNVPAGLNNAVAIAAGGFHNLALKSDGTLVAWGYNADGQSTVPTGLNNVVAISGGSFHSLALKRDGTVVAWGFNYNGEANVPSGLNKVVAISGGGNHSLALKSDGTVVAWGLNRHGETDVPAGLSKVVAISAGSQYSLALWLSDTTPPTTTASTNPASPNPNGWFNTDVTVSLSAADNTGGSGVQSITYSTSGAQTSPATTGSATSASLTISTEGSTTISYYATDQVGNQETTKTLTIQLDKTPPNVTATPDRAPDSQGWYNHPLTLSFSGDDGAGSGVASCDTPKSYSGPDSASASVTGNCTDAADNIGSATTTFMYDATKPIVSYTGNAGSYTVDQTVSITCQASDNLSGLATTTCANISGPAYSFTLANNTFSATATDKAGNVGSGVTSFTVKVTFDSLCTLSANFSTDPAVDQGLCDKLVAAKAAAASGDTKTKNNNLDAYRQQVAAQSGKALTTQQATILTNLSKTL